MFKLGEVRPKKQIVKRSELKRPDISMLKDQQKKAYDILHKFLSQPDGGMFMLQGFAGTGKSFLISKLTETLLFERVATGGIFSPFKIANTAPTNKAVKVACQMAEFSHYNISYMTIHRLLGLKEQIQSDGTIEYVQDQAFIPAIKDHKIVIIDEVSMLPPQIFHILNLYTDEIKILFVGDGAQIPPVGHPESIPVNEKQREKYNIGFVELTDIIRQAKENPIIEMATFVRSNLTKSIDLRLAFPQKMVFEKSKGVRFLAKQESEYLEELLLHIFTSDNFTQNSDYGKVICYRNKIVAYFNDIIRRMIFKRDYLERLEIGEKIVTAEAVVEGKTVIIPNSEELEIVELQKAVDTIDAEEPIKLPFYYAHVKYFDEDNSPVTQTIKILTTEGQKKYDSLLKEIAEMAKGFPKGSLMAVEAWKNFYALKKAYAAIVYNYAITAHKSQGSTYDNVIVVEKDIRRIDVIKDRNRLLYTAITRAKHRVYIV